MTAPTVAPVEIPISELRPQPGPQETFLSSSADIAIFGGSAGGGKSFSLLMDPLRFVGIRGFGAVIFRRNGTDLTQEGGLWDESLRLYVPLGGLPRESTGRLDYRFPAKSRISFSHLQTEETVQQKMGGQIAMIGFDELTHFTWSQFWLMQSRNRSTCGIRPYIRATCNPDPDHWLASFISWWLCEETGYPISHHWWDRVDPKYKRIERSGKIRWLIKIDEALNWFDSRKQAIAWRDERGLGDEFEPLSVTFIPSRLEDNPALMQKDPSYRSKLASLGRVDRARLLEGNWKIRHRAGLVFQRSDFRVMESEEWEKHLREVTRSVRSWDLGGTEAKKATTAKKMSQKLANDPDWTVGVHAHLLRNKDIVFTDMRRDRLRPGAVRDLVRKTAEQDGKRIVIRIPQDPGQAGKDQIHDYQKSVLFGYSLYSRPETGSKLTRADSFARYVEQGHVYIVRAAWNDSFLAELESFPSDGIHDDIVDAASGAYSYLTEKGPSTVDAVAAHRGRML